MNMLLLKCPKCGNTMRSEPKGMVGNKRKRCVYCGHSFEMRKYVVKEIR